MFTLASNPPPPLPLPRLPACLILLVLGFLTRCKAREKTRCETPVSGAPAEAFLRLEEMSRESAKVSNQYTPFVSCGVCSKSGVVPPEVHKSSPMGYISDLMKVHASRPFCFYVFHFTLFRFVCVCFVTLCVCVFVAQIMAPVFVM